MTDDVDNLITNGKMASILLDHIDSKLLDSIDENTIIKIATTEDGKPENYILGSISDKTILVDPLMRWDDDRIIFSNGVELTIIDEEMILI